MSRTVHFNFGRTLSRRTLLRGAGVTLALPWLSAMQSAFARAESSSAPPRRFVAMTLGLGLHAENLFPEQDGRGYRPTPYLKPLEDLRDKFTVVSGTSHPGVGGGHRAEASILTANPGAPVGRTSNTISLDQYMARHLGHHTRFPSLVLGIQGSNSPSYTENGAMVPADDSPARMFSRLFVDDTPDEQARQADRARQGQSIMDLVRDDAKRLSRQLGSGDRDRLDAYFTSVRDLEVRLAESEAWARRPKPKVDAPKPVDISNPNDYVGRQRLMNDVIRLALETDSTRFIVFHLRPIGGVVPVEGVEQGYHYLSHHGRDEEKIEQLALVEAAIMTAWGEFLRGLADAGEQGSTLLDQTAVLLTSNLGNASSHDTKNMPVLLAGGGFRHGQHLAFDRKNNYPLPNLFVSLMQRMGLEEERFATSTGTLRGLEML
jgi:hypothetical protein